MKCSSLHFSPSFNFDEDLKKSAEGLRLSQVSEIAIFPSSDCHQEEAFDLTLKASHKSSISCHFD
jgi:hypothetical protein